MMKLFIPQTSYIYSDVLDGDKLKKARCARVLFTDDQSDATDR